MGNRLCMQNTVGDAAATQERVMCLDVATGKPIWERRFSVYLSDVPQHRAAWASPALDPETGNIYAFTVGAQLLALAPDGKTLWSRSMADEYGAVTTHGGRTVSPVIDGDKVVINVLNAGWGDQARTQQPVLRLRQADRRADLGQCAADLALRHQLLHARSPPTSAASHMLIVGGTDGVIHALNAGTGEQLWGWHVTQAGHQQQRGGERHHGVRDPQRREHRRRARWAWWRRSTARSAARWSRRMSKWATLGFLGGFASPVIDAERLYHVDNGAVLGAFDRASGRALWHRNLGTIQKASPVLADGKLYVGTENGKFFILRPRADGVDVLDEDWLGSPQDAGGDHRVADRRERPRVRGVDGRARTRSGRQGRARVPDVQPKPAPPRPPRREPRRARPPACWCSRRR